MRPNLKINIGSLKLNNPVMVASGTFGYAEEFKDFLDLKEIGAIATKTVTLRPRQGNPPPRTCETPAGMLNSIGLENPGIEVFLRDKLPGLARYGVPLIVSVSSEGDPGEFAELVRALDKIKAAAAIELNISCPNLRKLAGWPVGRLAGSTGKQANRQTGKLISQDAGATYRVVKAARRVTRKTLITKLSPNVTDISEIARAAEDAGSDALALINTLIGLSVDIKTGRPKISAVCAGLSGPAIRPVAVRMVWEVYQQVKIPIIGMGGISDTASALEFILAGASAVAVGTANFVNPKAASEIIAGLNAYLIENKINNINKLIGSLRV
jgi:dihydroorotate dehydrogenase (NAD+) catalytic subunit